MLLTTASAAGAAWLMVRAAAGKKVLTAQKPRRCAACGKERGRGRCECTGGWRG
jgi:hypothetical protein